MMIAGPVFLIPASLLLVFRELRIFQARSAERVLKTNWSNDDRLTCYKPGLSAKAK